MVDGRGCSGAATGHYRVKPAPQTLYNNIINSLLEVCACKLQYILRKSGLIRAPPPPSPAPQLKIMMEGMIGQLKSAPDPEILVLIAWPL